MSIDGPINRIIGPLVAPNVATTTSLLEKLASGHKGRLRVDVPSEQKMFIETLMNSGFIVVNQPPIMVKNNDSIHKRNGHLFGIAAQIFG
ncbi:hypothetical protein BACCIP111883_01896 [Sutcliffiella rhizosphaerae]|uniref:YitH/HolE acetyltransferase (GNAT) domain-containing protein n=2 Tax=Sutcliffiella rhizosphaerae TaxID=2880967 RepID=A0ABM8YMD3_9BACI|nr:hypothetical protein BACCIP111883_01896 [Sutcliffiella rhizosphaerae]